MADKDITIKITTTADTSGADAAAASLKRLTAAAASPGAGADHTDISDLNARLENMKERVAALGVEANSGENMGERTAALDGSVGRLKEITTGIGAVTTAAKFCGAALDQITKGIASIDMKKLSDVDPAAAKELEKINFWIGAMEHPMDAAVQGLHKLFTGETVGENFATLKASLEATAKGVEAAFDRMVTRGAASMQQIEAIMTAILQANALLDAQDKTSAAARDRQDANDLASGKDPDDVKSDRALWDREKKLGSLRRQMGSNMAGIGEEWDSIQTQRRNLANAELAPDADFEKIKAKRAALDAQEKKLLDRRDHVLGKNAVLVEAQATVMQESDGQIEAARRQKSDRLRNAEDKDDARQAATRQGRVAIGFGAADAAHQAEAAGYSEKDTSALEQAAALLRKDPSQSNEARVMALLSRVVAWADKSGSASDAKLTALEKKINTLESQAKNNR